MYKVTDTREMQVLTPGGNSETVNRVWLKTARGATGSVDVPLDKWNKVDLKIILDEKAADLDLPFDLLG